MIRLLWAKLCKWGYDYDRDIEAYSLRVCDRETIELPNPLRFSIQKASGGTVVEVRSYDPKKDENVYFLHVIADNNDVAESIGKIVTFEMLKKV
jgi:hypothetical protein